MNYIIKSIDECDEDVYKYIYDNLGIYEKNKVDKLFNNKLSLLGYYELYILLKKRNINLFESKIKYNKFNKPYIDNIHFNIAHDNKVTVCAISDTPIGVDIIYLKRSNSKINKKKFAIKEAYIKMVGNTILNINNVSLNHIYTNCYIKEIYYEDYLIIICKKK